MIPKSGKETDPTRLTRELINSDRINSVSELDLLIPEKIVLLFPDRSEILGEEGMVMIPVWEGHRFSCWTGTEPVLRSADFIDVFGRKWYLFKSRN